MDLQTFKAPTMAEALGQVKNAMGHDAVILHTRTYQMRRWLGLQRREIVEITAGRGLRVPSRSARAPVQPASRVQVGAAAYARSAVAAPSAQPTITSPAETRKQLLESPAASNAMMMGVSQEVNSLKAMVQNLVAEVRHQQAPQVPEELFQYYSQLIENQVASELASSIMRNIQRNVRPEHLQQPAFVREKLAEQLEKMLPTTGPIQRTKTTGAHIVALIGPTGVGKTTTIAKLAANLKLREKHRVGMITLDTYRIAAIDQLKKYANIIDAPLHVVSNHEDMRTALDAMQSMDFILIDTAGRSPNDTLKLHELRGFLDVAKPDEVHLVISSTASQACVELAVSRFSDVRVDKIIFTKIDEAAHVGVVLNVVHKVNKSLSYITTGQDVPDDIEVGRGRKLAQLILGNSL